MTKQRPLRVGELVRRKKPVGFKGTVYQVKDGRVWVRWWRTPSGREVDIDKWHDREELVPI